LKILHLHGISANFLCFIIADFRRLLLIAGQSPGVKEHSRE